MIALDAGAALMLVLLLLIVGALIGVTAAGESIERVVVVRGGDDVGVLEDKLNHEVAAGRARSPRARDLLHRQAAHRPSPQGSKRLMAAVRGRSRSEMGRLFGPLIATGGTNKVVVPHVPAAGLTRNVGRLLTRMLVLFIGG